MLVERSHSIVACKLYIYYSASRGFRVRHRLCVYKIMSPMYGTRQCKENDNKKIWRTKWLCNLCVGFFYPRTNSKPNVVIVRVRVVWQTILYSHCATCVIRLPKKKKHFYSFSQMNCGLTSKPSFQTDQLFQFGFGIFAIFIDNSIDWIARL